MTSNSVGTRTYDGVQPPSVEIDDETRSKIEDWAVGDVTIRVQGKNRQPRYALEEVGDDMEVRCPSNYDHDNRNNDTTWNVEGEVEKSGKLVEGLEVVETVMSNVANIWSIEPIENPQEASKDDLYGSIEISEFGPSYKSIWCRHSEEYGAFLEGESFEKVTDQLEEGFEAYTQNTVSHSPENGNYTKELEVYAGIFNDGEFGVRAEVIGREPEPEDAQILEYVSRKLEDGFEERISLHGDWSDLELS